MSIRRPHLILPVCLALAAVASADIVRLKDDRKLRGGVQRDDETGVVWNPYHSRHPDMVFEVEHFPRKQVREVVLEEPEFREFLRRARGLSGADADAWVEVAGWCDERKLAAEKEYSLLRALELDPLHAGALKAFGRSRFPRIARGNPAFDAAAKAAIEEYLAVRDPDERAKAYGRLKREQSVDLPQEYLDRILRAIDQKKGLENDRPLTLRSAESAGEYTLFVPGEYDPRRPWPLVLGLHGGGAGGKDGDAVIGRGRDAVNFYIREAAARGYLVACPTALTAPWSATPNHALIEAVLEEVQLLYHIDLNRVYLTGHSMGGLGAWYYGEKFAERFAAVSPMAGGGSSFQRMVATNTPIFIFHGADDRVVGPSHDRLLAKGLAKTKHDFIYTELDGVGHGFPASIQRDLFEFFDLRRLAVLRGKRPGPPSPEPRSSFLVKVSRDEERYLGDPREYGGQEGGRDEGKRLLKDLRLGGGKAAAAADRLGEMKDPDTVKPLSDLLRHPRTPDDVREQAARALGRIGNRDGFPGLAACLRSENPEVFAASARAMALIEDPGGKAAGALLESLGHLDRMLQSKRIGGNQIHISDWERWLPAFAAVVEGLGRLKPEGSSAAIGKTAVKSAVCGDWDVLHSQRVGQDPRRARRTLALAAAEALKAIGDEDAKSALARMREACADDPEIVEACEPPG